MLGGRAQVTRVFQCGGREKVIEECKNDQVPGGRPRIYIIDGDLGLLAGDNPIVLNLNRLYVLSVYASENLLISKKAISEIAYECLSNNSREEIEKVLELDDFFSQLSRLFVPLFILYAAARVLTFTTKTTGFNVMQLCTEGGRNITLDETKVAAHSEKLRENMIGSTDAKKLEEVIQTISRGILIDFWSLRLFVSGKTYILPLVFHLLHRNASYLGTIENLKVRLARYTKLDIDKGL